MNTLNQKFDTRQLSSASSTEA